MKTCNITECLIVLDFFKMQKYKKRLNQFLNFGKKYENQVLVIGHLPKLESSYFRDMSKSFHGLLLVIEKIDDFCIERNMYFCNNSLNFGLCPNSN